jgi:23S rRNA (uracil1939-C5)-methyltransferase
MGHYARGTRRVIPIVECPVHDPRGNAFAFTARDIFQQAAERGARTATLRGMAVRVGCHSGETMATLVVSDDRDRGVRAATRRLIDAAAPSSMHLNAHPREDGFIFGRDTRRLQGSARMREDAAGAVFLISPTAFFQTNVRAAELLVRLVLEAVPPGATVLDLYAGSGLFAIPLALAGHDVVAVEENRVSVADGEAALKLNPGAGQRCRFIARPVEKAIAALSRTDVVILDPPREGCSPAALTGIVSRLAPRRILYVSCNPEALAGDLGTIIRGGYQLRSIQPVDMFPHSAHVEALAVLEK